MENEAEKIDDWIEGLETIEWWFRDHIIHDIRQSGYNISPEGIKDETSYAMLLKHVQTFLEDYKERELLEPGATMLDGLKKLSSDHQTFRQRILILENMMEEIQSTCTKPLKEEN